MPAVAQISVDFARRSEIISSSSIQPTNVKSVNPLTLTQYLLFNRELTGPGENNGITLPSNLSYQGGFITAGNKINVKHDSDLQLRENLEVGKRVRTEFIVSRTKENNEFYENDRNPSSRAVTISPRVEDESNTFINISTDPSVRSIKLYTNITSRETFITLENSSNNNNISLKTTTLNTTAPVINITGSTTHTGTVLITGETTINNNVNVRDNFNLGTTSYNTFNVTAATGNVAQKGNLNINNGQFVVTAATGTVTHEGNLNINNGQFVVTASNGSVSQLGGLTINTNKFTVNSSTGDTYIDGTLSVNTNLNLTGDLAIGTTKFTVESTTGNTVVQGTLNVTGITDIASNLRINTNKFTVAAGTGNTVIAGTLNVTGETNITSNLKINTNKFTVAAGTGNTVIAGTLDVTGTSNFTGKVTGTTLGMSGDATIGFTGTPVARLHVRTVGGSNENPDIRLDTETTNGSFLDFHIAASANNYNPAVENLDKTIIFSNGTKNTGNLFIGPWSDNGYGIRIRSDGTTNVGGTLAASRLTGLAAPTQNTDAANKKYVDDLYNAAVANSWKPTSSNICAFYKTAARWSNGGIGSHNLVGNRYTPAGSWFLIYWSMSSRDGGQTDDNAWWFAQLLAANVGTSFDVYAWILGLGNSTSYGGNGYTGIGIGFKYA